MILASLISRVLVFATIDLGLCFIACCLCFFLLRNPYPIKCYLVIA